tara:strand:- start:9244 stop:9483 length:240 start_codon:yes stop_codon:yes gene_type:complete
MADIMNTLFGPLDRKYCAYFFLLSIIGFVLMTLLVLSSLIIGLSKGKGIDFYFQMISVAVGYAIFYFQNRLLHTMCSGV